MKITVIGANGQVGSEVTLVLARMPGVEIIPVSRSHSGSAFLRYHGIRVRHGSIADPNDAPRLLQGADIVANFALATGTPAESFQTNQRIIEQTFQAAPKGAVIVFFSTLAVLGNFDETKRRQRTIYTKLKLENEQQVLQTAAKTGQRAYVLRIGHVGGPFQRITGTWRDEVKSGTVVLIDPERLSNVTYTLAIADALTSIGSGKAGEPGLYDLLNVPQWTWREIYDYEARRLGLSPDYERDATRQPAPAGAARSLKGAILKTVDALGLKDAALRLASQLPASLNDSMKAEAYVSRARSEIALLQTPPRAAAASQRWPGLTPTQLSGLKPTRDLLDLWDGIEALPEVTQRWPRAL